MSTYTISGLRKTLGLSTANQVRNRIEAIKDLLQDHLRRGPNNQILVNEAGVELLRRLQEMYDSGLTMTEASSVLRATSVSHGSSSSPVSSRIGLNRTIPIETDSKLDLLRSELAALRDRVSFLEQVILRDAPSPTTPPWWEALRETLDAT